MRSVACIAAILACLTLGGRWWLAWEPAADMSAAVSPGKKTDFAPWIEPPAGKPNRDSKFDTGVPAAP